MLNTIKGLIGEGKTQEAISQMSRLASGNSDIKNSVMQLSGQYAQANFAYAMGLTDASSHMSTLTKVNYGLLSLLDQMQSEGLLSGGAMPSDSEHEGPKTKLLFLAANPVDAPSHLQLEKEYLEIRKIFKNHRDRFSITEEFDVTLDTFFEAIYREKPNIIHMSGFSEEAGVYLLQKHEHTSYMIPYEFLAPAFKMLKDSVECVFFNTGTSNLFSKVISRVIPYAVGIRGMVSDEEAISFSSGFYAALALDKNYEKAFQMGRDLLGLSPESQKYFLYQNGLCAEDTTTPDDFYPQQKQEKQPAKKGK
jgi:hypothetical protein